jgi:glycosyltransferase involved in cell wall biosynthesis
MKVSVLLMTYNHERFIEQAIESVLSQEVTFDIEIIVSEDRSTDRTREIVLAYRQRHPEKFRLLLSERNLRNNEVVARGLRAARGLYIAMLDGDDYWTSAHKLQKQAEFLDRHPECAVCFHNAAVIHEDGTRQPYHWNSPGQKEISTIEDIWRGNFITTAATMFRRGLISEIPAWYIPMFPITDWPLHILNAEHGTIGYIDEVMSVYRQHGGGLYSPMTEIEKQAATGRFYATMNRNLRFKYDRMVRDACARYFFEWAEEYVKRGEPKRAAVCLGKSLAGGGIDHPISARSLARLAVSIGALPFMRHREAASIR